jgi:acyl-CoA thioester hydrolase
MVCRTERRVIFGETDAMRIVYYSNYLEYFEVGRAEFFRQYDSPFTHYIRQGLYLAVTHTAVRYHRPARYDDVLIIEARLARLGRASLDMEYTILDKATGEQVTTGMTGHALLDEAGRVRRFEKDFVERMKPLVSASPRRRRPPHERRRTP